MLTPEERKEHERARKRQWQRKNRGMLDAPREQLSGPCEICGLERGKLHLDHCHTTGKIRGWLCQHCNVRMAALDDREWFEKAEAYRVKNQ